MNCPNCKSEKRKISKEFAEYIELTCKDCGYIWIEDKLNPYNRDYLSTNKGIQGNKYELMMGDLDDLEQSLKELEDLLKPFTFFSVSFMDLLDSDKNEDNRNK